MTVNSGDLWVAEESVHGGRSFSAGSRVNEFSATGSLLSQINEQPGTEDLSKGIALATVNSEPQIFVGGDDLQPTPHEGIVTVFEGAGEHSLLSTWNGVPGEVFESINSVASDSSKVRPEDWAAGDIYAADASNTIDVIKPGSGGEKQYLAKVSGITANNLPFAGAMPGELFQHLGQITVNAVNGDLLVVEHQQSVVDVLEPGSTMDEYRLVMQLSGTPYAGAFQSIGSIATDSGDGEIYVVEEARHVIDEFDRAGNYLGRIAGSGAPGPFEQLKGIAVDPGSHQVYVGNRYKANINNEASSVGEIDVFGPDLTLPEVKTGAAEEVASSSARLAGTVDDEEAGSATCAFVWGPTSEFGHEANCSSAVEDPGEVAVSAVLSGLEPDTEYFYRLQASNHNGLNSGEPLGEELHFTTLGPGLHGENATKVSATGASLNAKINPHNETAFFLFEYGTTDEEMQLSPAGTAPYGALVGSGNCDEPGTQTCGEDTGKLGNLTPDTLYHYRVRVTTERTVVEEGQSKTKRETFYGPDQTFTTQSGSEVNELPDGRSWELVSPAEKHGALIEPIREGVTEAAGNGGAFTFLTSTPAGGSAEGYAGSAQILSRRVAPGKWNAVDIATPNVTPPGAFPDVGTEYRLFTSNLEAAIVEPLGAFSPLTGKEVPPFASESTVYLRGNVACGSVPMPCFTPLVTSTNVPAGTTLDGNAGADRGHVQFVGANREASRVILKSEVGLTATPSDTGGLYEWTAGELRQVSVLPAGEGGAPTALAGLGTERNRVTRNAVSEDGARVVWSNGEHLYMWNAASGESGRLDVLHGGSGGGVASAEYQGASASGSRMFFTDQQALTAGASGRDLYVCQVAITNGVAGCETLVDLAHNVTGVLPGVSEDGSDAYVVSGTQLEIAQEQDGVWSVLPIAKLSSADFPDWAGGEAEGRGLPGLTARVSPSGQFLAFMSQNSLTGYDNHDAASGEPDEEVYLYDATARTLICASCDPTGARPHGVQSTVGGEEKLFDGQNAWPSGTWIAGNVPGWTPYQVEQSLYQSRYLSNSGRLFFNSSDALVPGDVNGEMDVYEFEPPGLGGCSAGASGYNPKSEGCLGLISSGRSGEESVFLDASESGGDVFFMTSERLVAADQDKSFDVYDAHECTAESSCAAEGSVVPPECVSADACKPSPVPQPTIFGAPASSTFSGTGNLAPPAVVKPKPPTRAQLLAKALKGCRGRFAHAKKRRSCERQARKRYGHTSPHQSQKGESSSKSSPLAMGRERRTK